MAYKSHSRIEVKSERRWPPVDPDRFIDLRIYVSPKAIAITLAILVVLGRLIELGSTVIFNHC